MVTPTTPPAPPKPTIQVPKQDPAPAAETPLERRQRLLRHVKVVRERLLFQMGDVKNKTAGFTYVWVNIDNRRQVHFQAVGYELVTSSTDPGATSHWKMDDGTHVRGDVILYRIPTDLYEAIQYEGQLRSIEAIESTKEDFVAFAERERIPVRIPKT